MKLVFEGRKGFSLFVTIKNTDITTKTNKSMTYGVGCFFIRDSQGLYHYISNEIASRFKSLPPYDFTLECEEYING